MDANSAGYDRSEAVFCWFWRKTLDKNSELQILNGKAFYHVS
jgi:hypothetical protein